MKVTVITPTTHDRANMNRRITDLMQAQDYPAFEHLYDFSDNPIGTKRNILCARAEGDIIIHADSDDYYAPDWITRSVEHLLSSGADITGLKRAYFYEPGKNLWQYNYTGSQGYVIGATMCYKRSWWEQNPFKDFQVGEDLKFCVHANVKAHDYINGFYASIHNQNTASHLALSGMKKLPLTEYNRIFH